MFIKSFGLLVYSSITACSNYQYNIDNINVTFMFKYKFKRE